VIVGTSLYSFVEGQNGCLPKRPHRGKATTPTTPPLLLPARMRGCDVIAAKFGAKWIRKDQTSNKSITLSILLGFLKLKKFLVAENNTKALIMIP